MESQPRKMKSGYFVSKSRAVLLVIVVIVVIVVVGLLAGFLSGRCSDDQGSKRSDGRSGEAGSGGGGARTTPAGPPEEPGPWQNPFLPPHLIPVHYNLSFFPDFYFEGSTFSGEVDILLNVTKETKLLIVHYKMMNVSDSRVEDYSSGEGARTSVGERGPNVMHPNFSGHFVSVIESVLCAEMALGIREVTTGPNLAMESQSSLSIRRLFGCRRNKRMRVRGV